MPERPGSLFDALPGMPRSALLAGWIAVSGVALAQSDEGPADGRGGEAVRDEAAGAIAGPGAGGETLDELLGLEAPVSPGGDRSDAVEAADLGGTGEVADRARREGLLDEAIRSDLERAADEQLSGAAVSAMFESAVRDMESVAQRLGRRFDTGRETRRMQDEIVAKLESVLEAAIQQQRQQQQQSSGSPSPQQQDQGSAQNASQPGQQPGGQGSQSASASASSSPSSQANQGQTAPTRPQGGAPDRPLAELREQWGNLPPRVRDELLEGLDERFSPHYQRLTEAYYRRLAEQATEGGNR